MSSPAELILASTSPYRRALLERLRLPFRCIAPGIEETHVRGEGPEDRALRLALAKAAAVAAQFPDAAVIGGDQVAVCADEVLDKPGTTAVACAQLRRLSGTVATFHSTVVVQHLQGRHLDAFTHQTAVRFRHLTDDEIERYVALEQPLDCAGSFRSEGLGSVLFEAIVGDDPTGLVGLPLIRLSASLRALGYALP